MISIFIDNEGPCTLNDNAQGNLVELAKEGGLGEEVGIRAFKNLSNIDDIWGDFHKIKKDPTYSSGHTLKVVLPFYKALGASSQWLYDFAKKNLRLVPSIKEVLTDLNQKYELWQVSTSYQFFIKAFCDKVGFPLSKTFCTEVKEFDQIPISEKEKKILLSFLGKISQIPTIKYDKKTGKVAKEHQSYYNFITDFIWETVYNLPVGEFLKSVHPVGQVQKKEAIEKVSQRFNITKKNIFYIGDSQTDVLAVKWLREEGLTMMFNGKGRVLSLSDIAYIGEDARAIEEAADLFAKKGRQEVINYYKSIRKAPGGLISAVSSKNSKKLETMSVKKRKEFRGISIGELT